MRALTALGVSLLVVGTLVIVAPSGAFESLSAERGIGAETATDESDALLGLESSYDGTEIQYESGWFGSDTGAEVATVANNADAEWPAVNVEVSSVTWADRTSDRILRVADAPGSLAPNETGAIELECSQAVTGNANDATVELDITAGGSNAPVSVDRRAFPVSDVAFDCEGSDDAGATPPTDPTPISDIDSLAVTGTPTARESSGVPLDPNSRVTFDLEYGGDEPITVTAIQIRETNSNATRVEYIASIIGGTDAEIEVDEQGVLDVDNGLTIGDVAYNFDSSAAIQPGETVSVDIEQFRSGGYGGQTDMSDTTMTVVLTIEGLESSNSTTAVPVEIELEVE